MRRIKALALGLLYGLAAVTAPIADSGSAGACPTKMRTLQLGFYAYFAPVSYSADPDPASSGFDDHLGYEADLLTAVESMEGVNLSFSRHGIGDWDGIWLLPAGPRYDIVGGGITILETRTRDETGARKVVFTAGHIEFRQSLLVRAADAARLAEHRELTGADRVGVLLGTTGEARLLELTGITDAAGVVAAGTQVETAGGVVVADGSGAYVINAAGATAGLSARRRLKAADEGKPQVVYFADEPALIEALAARRIDAIAQGVVANRTEAAGGDYMVTALDARAETGGFALAVEDAELAECLDRLIAWLTDDGHIGYGEWHEDPSIFMLRARRWPGTGR